MVIRSLSLLSPSNHQSLAHSSILSSLTPSLFLGGFSSLSSFIHSFIPSFSRYILCQSFSLSVYHSLLLSFLSSSPPSSHIFMLKVRRMAVGWGRERGKKRRRRESMGASVRERYRSQTRESLCLPFLQLPISLPPKGPLADICG